MPLDDMLAPRKRQQVGTSPSKEVHTIAILGFGTVGTSVARILSQPAIRGLRLTHIYNRGIESKKVDWLPSHVRWTENINDVLSSDVDVVVELIGGLEPAGDWVRSALTAGKSVVTANKQLIAECGPELLSLARRMKQQIAFGASVAGGVPVISAMQEGLAGDGLLKICGILNGTCNYILSRIESCGVSFSSALAEAQKLGYAEANPSEDVDGADARAKLAILARVGLRSNLRPSEIACRSISAVEAVDFEYAKLLDCTIRQISRAELKGNHLFAAVQAAVVPLLSPLAHVEGVQNMVMVTGKFGGETVFTGHGAGGNPTAVAVVSDIIAIAQAKQEMTSGFAPVQEFSPTHEFLTRHYLRFTVRDRPGIIAAVAAILAQYNINIDSVLQKPGHSKSSLPFVITLEACPASLVDEALQQISQLDFLVQPCLHLPILD